MIITLREMASDAESTSNRRRVSNRKSAKRLRMDQQEREELRELLREEARLEAENEKLRQMTEAVTRKYFFVESHNNVLRALLAELTDLLK